MEDSGYPAWEKELQIKKLHPHDRSIGYTLPLYLWVNILNRQFSVYHHTGYIVHVIACSPPQKTICL